MVNYLQTIIVAVIVIGVGGGGFALLYKFFAPKKQTWVAKVWQKGDGVKPFPTDEKGKVISNIKRNDLIPFALDILERHEEAAGITRYRLRKLKKIAPTIRAEHVNNWGEGKKEVDLLIDGDTLTFLNKSYDKDIGEMIFVPTPADERNQIKAEISDRHQRIKNEKDLLQKLLPMVTVGIVMVALVACVMSIGETWKYTIDKSDERLRLPPKVNAPQQPAKADVGVQETNKEGAG